MKRLLIVVLALLAILLFSSVFVVAEGERGIVLQFGKVKREQDSELPVVYQPGLHFKVPMIDKVRKLDARIQTLDDQVDRFVTSEKKDLIIDSYVKWRIDNFAAYYLASGGGNRLQAESLLRRRVNTSLRSEIGNRTIGNIVSGKGEVTGDGSGDISAREAVMENTLNALQQSSSELGIKVVDVRIKQINLPTEVSNSIYQRMRAERTAVAREHRSEGREQAEIIKAEADRRVTIMIADAQRNSRTLRGEGDAEAARIYADAYAANPQFFNFVRSLEAYRKSFEQGGDMMILKPEGDFFRFLKDPSGSN